MKRASAQKQRGFTLLEVMVALVIFLAGVVGILGLFAAGLAMHRNATQNAIVAAAVEDVHFQIEEAARVFGAPGIDEETPILKRVPISGYPRYFYDATFTQDPDLGVDGGLLASVHVYTLDAGKQRGEWFTMFLRPRASAEQLIRDVLEK